MFDVYRVKQCNHTLYIWTMLGAIKTTQLSWSLNWASSPEKKRGSKAGHQRTAQRTTTDCSSLKSVQDVLTSRCTLISPSSCFPRLVAKRKISAAPFLLLRSTSPFACAFKPWALLNTVRPWCYSDCLLVVSRTWFLSLPPPIWFLGEGPLETLE